MRKAPFRLAPKSKRRHKRRVEHQRPLTAQMAPSHAIGGCVGSYITDTKYKE